MSNIVENPRGGCVVAGINANLLAIDRVCTIYHSGPGCCMQTTAAQAGMSGNKSPGFVNDVSIPCTNMLEKEVVFGGIRKLETTVQGTIEIIDADCYFILLGCTGGIIGDDIESVAEEFREKGYPVYAIEVPGFFGNSNLGYEESWNALIEQVVVPREKEKNLVNLFGIVPYQDPYWSGNLEEISRTLKRLGLKVNTFYTEHQNIENVKNSSAAALNIILNPWLFHGPAKKYEEKFGVPSLRISGLPIGATDTTAFIRQVAEALHLDQDLVEKVIGDEEDYVYSYLEQITGVLRWQRFGVIGDSNVAIGITRYLANDYSFTPRYVIISEQIWSADAREEIQRKLTGLEYAKAPEVYFASDQFEIDRIIREHEEVTLIVGSSNDREAASYVDAQFLEAAFPVTNRLFLNRALAGYRGSLTLTEDIFNNY